MRHIISRVISKICVYFTSLQLKIRAMTDSEEDVKETYSKIIRSIPNLNERILGKCKSCGSAFTGYLFEPKTKICHQNTN